MKAFLQKSGMLLCLLSVVLPLMIACRDTQLSRESSLRPKQLHWMDLAALEVAVQRLLESSRLASRAPGVTKRYANFLRFSYQTASKNGQNVDDGIHLLNYLRHVHVRNGGESALWKEAVRAAKEAGVDKDGMPLLPIPAEFKE